MAGTALSILNKIKEQVKECEAAWVEARELNKQIQQFEVTIMMIPSRAPVPGEEETQPTSQNNNKIETNNGVGSVVREMGTEMVNFAANKAKDAAMNAITKSPAGVVVEIFQIGKDLEPIFDEGVSPGQQLQKMKTEKDESGMRVFSDLEVMFQGMAFIVMSALQSIKAASEVLIRLNEIGKPNCFFVCMPWKVQETLELKEELSGHRENITRQVTALQTAIGVASYAVQLEQLESVLDATSVFQHRDMKMLWRKKIGCDKTKVPIAEFCESFLSATSKEIDQGRVHYDISENIDRKSKADIALVRFLNELYNDNGDENLTVYELSSALQQKEKEGKIINKKSVEYTVLQLLQKEVEFLKSIRFRYIDHDVGEDNQPGTKDDVEKIFTGEPITLKPFSRALIIAEVSMMRTDFYEYDHLALLRYDRPRNPLEKILPSDVSYELSVEKGSKCYVQKSMNSTLLGDDDINWNAFRIFRGQAKPSVFTSKQNFEIVKKSSPELASNQNIVPHMTAESKPILDPKLQKKDEKDNDDDDEMGPNDGLQKIRILYTPFIMSPGIYTPRYCLDSYEEKNDGLSEKKKMAASLKSYYRGNIDVNPTLAEEKSETKAESKPVRRKSYLIPGTEENKNLAHLGPLIHCQDVLEMVWGEVEENWEDYGVEEEEKKTKWRPHLQSEYPYLKQKIVQKGELPEKIAVFVNVPKRRKPKKEKDDKKKTDELINPTHIGLFRKNDENDDDWILVGQTIKIKDDEPIYEFDTKSLLGEDHSTCHLIVAFENLTISDKPILDNHLIPFVELQIDPQYNEQVESYEDYYDSDEYWSEDDDDEEGDEDEGENEEGENNTEGGQSDAEHNESDAEGGGSDVNHEDVMTHMEGQDDEEDDGDESNIAKNPLLNNRG